MSHVGKRQRQARALERANLRESMTDEQRAAKDDATKLKHGNAKVRSEAEEAMRRV